MKKPILCFLLLSTLCCVRAQQPAAPAATPTVEELAAEVQALKTKTSAWDKIVPHLPNISGYVQLGYEWSNTSSNFYIRRVRLNLAGDIVAGKLDYRMQVEFANSPKLSDAYLRYRPFNALNFKLGEYKVPFSIENTEYVPLKLELIEYPLVLRKLMGFSDMCGLSATGRDMGTTLYGGFFKRDGYSIVNYDLGVFNGNGINAKDDNKSKDIVARLMLKPISGLLLSASYYRGEYGPEYLTRERYGAGACYDRDRWMLRGEWIGGTTGLPAADGSGRFDSDGWYVTGGWRATRSLMPVVRYDTFDADADNSSTRQTNYTAGLLWQPVKYLRCQLNYTYEEYAAQGKANRNVVSVMFSGIF